MFKNNKKAIYILIIFSLVFLFLGFIISIFKSLDNEILLNLVILFTIFIALFFLLAKRHKPVDELISISRTFIESSLLYQDCASFIISDKGDITQLIYNNLKGFDLKSYSNIQDISDNYIDKQEISHFINSAVDNNFKSIIIYKSTGIFSLEGVLSKQSFKENRIIVLLKEITRYENMSSENKILVEKNLQLDSTISDITKVNEDVFDVLGDLHYPLIIFKLSPVGILDKVNYINHRAISDFKYNENEGLTSLNFYSNSDLTTDVFLHNFYEKPSLSRVVQSFTGVKYLFDFKQSYNASSVILRVTALNDENNSGILESYISNFKKLSDGVIIFSKAGESVYMNDVMRDVLHLDIQNHKFVSVKELQENSDDIDSIDYIALVLNHRKSVFSHKYNLKNSLDTFISSFHPLFSDDEIEYIIRITYVLQENTIEDFHIKASESLDNILRTNVLNNFSHEIRTSMNSILGTADILNSFSNNKEQDEFINLIKRSGEDVHSLLESLRLFTQLSNKSLLPTIKQFTINDLVKLIQSETQFIRARFSKEHISINYLILPETLNFKIQNDIENVKNILIQLIENSLKYTEEGYINIGFNTFNDRQLTVWVEDSGAGITESILPTIFIPFSSVSPINSSASGLGIGLSISKELTELLGGNIEVESTFGKGSKFVVNIPVGYTNKTFNAITNDNVKILIAQYSYSFNKDLKKYLKSKNIAVFNANKGSEAIEIVSNNKDINIVFTDVTHSDITGIELIKALRRISPNIIVIAQAPYFILEEKIKLLNNGFNDYLVKPVYNNQFIKTIEKFMPAITN